MKILFFTLGYEGKLYNDLIKEFIKNSHEVVVVIPDDQISKTEIIETEDKIKLLRFRSLPLLNIGVIRKGIANILLPYLTISTVKKRLKEYCPDLILMSTPPLAFYNAVKYVKKRNPESVFYLILRDIHPEGAKFIGLDRYKLIYNYFRRIEIKLYNLSNFIGCMSPRNISFIMEKNPDIPSSKMRLLPNWETIEESIGLDLSIKTKYDLNNKFVAVYGGNMGIPQGLDIILELAKCKQKYSDVIFLFVGRGTEKERLENLSKSMELSNVRFMDFLPKKDYDKLMRVCDIGLISLHPNVPIPNIPSKTLSYFSMKLPVLASVDPVTDYGSFIIDASKGGLWSLAKDFELYSNNFDILYKDPVLRNQMKEDGYNYTKENFSTAIAYNEIISAFMSIKSQN